MELVGWKLLAVAISIAVLSGLLYWIVAGLAMLLAALVPTRPQFTQHLLRSAGDRDRLRHRDIGREMAGLLGGLLAGMLAGFVGWLLLAGRSIPALPAWALLLASGLSVALLAAAGYRLVRLLLLRRRLQFEWAARAAVGNILKRLNFSGNRIFHEVELEGAMIDHVVVGNKGVFAVNVVPRQLPRNPEGRAAAELRNGKLWLAGNVEALPVGDAARNMTLLTGALSRLAGHRVVVRSVLAVPGWHTAPNGSGNHLVLNESNLAMLPSWNTPDAYLMDEDCLEIQRFLHDASRLQRLR